MGIVVVVAWPITILAAFLTTNVTKLSLMMYVPLFRVLDYTLVVTILTLMIGGVRRMMRPPVMPIVEWKSILFYGLLSLFMSVSILWSDADLAVSGKLAMQMVGLNILALLIPYLFLTDYKSLKQFLVLHIIVSTIVCLVVIVARPDVAWERSGFLGSNPLAAAEHAVIMLLLIPLTIRQFNKMWWSFLLPIIPVACYAYIMTGSRGAILRLGLTFVIAALAIVKGAKAKAGIIVAVILIGVLFAGAMNYVGSESFMVRRIASLFIEGRHDESISARISMFEYVAEDFNVLGHGLGAFGVRYGAWRGLDPSERPHLAPLEVIYEFGMLGFVLWVSFLVALSRIALSRKGLHDMDLQTRQIRIVFSLLFLYYLVTHLTSSNLIAARSLCFYGSVAVVCARLRFSGTKIQTIAYYSGVQSFDLSRNYDNIYG